MEQPGKILTFCEDLVSTKQIIYKKYRNYFPSNPFKTVKSRHVFIIQNNFYDKYCLQHFICNLMWPDTSPIPWISTGLPHGPDSTMPLVSLSLLRLLWLLLSKPSLLLYPELSHAGPVLHYHSTTVNSSFHQFSLKSSHMTRSYFSCFIEAQISEKLVKGTHRESQLSSFTCPTSFYFTHPISEAIYSPSLVSCEVTSSSRNLDTIGHPISQRDSTTNKLFIKELFQALLFKYQDIL